MHCKHVFHKHEWNTIHPAHAALLMLGNLWHFLTTYFFWLSVWCALVIRFWEITWVISFSFIRHFPNLPSLHNAPILRSTFGLNVYWNHHFFYKSWWPFMGFLRFHISFYNSTRRIWIFWWLLCKSNFQLIFSLT